MMLSWIKRIQQFFSSKPSSPTWVSIGEQLDAEQTKVEPVISKVETKPEPSEFEKIYAKFNPMTDMIVMSTCKVKSLSKDEMNWLDSLGDRVYFFRTPYPVNMALISTR